jgi:hypothetical protein
VRGDLMVFVDFRKGGSRYFRMVYLFTLTNELAVLSKTLGVEVKGCAKSVFVKYLYEADILRYGIVVAEGYRLFLAVKIFHFILLGLFFASERTSGAMICAQKV